MALSTPIGRAAPVVPIVAGQGLAPIAQPVARPLSAGGGGFNGTGASGSWSPGAGQSGASGGWTPNPGTGQSPPAQNPASGLIGLTGILGSTIAGQTNSQIQQQEQALGQQLLQPVSLGGGGGGGGAGAGIAQQIANLQNQQHDLDLNQLGLQLRQLPGIGQQNLADYHTSLADITARQNLAKLGTQQNQQQLIADATARGAMTATGTGAQQSQYAQNLVNQLAQLHAATQNASSQYHQNQTALGKTYGQLVTDMQKMQLQKQIEQQQAKAASLGGGGGNPLGGLASFLQRMSVSQQLQQLQGQSINPIAQQTQFLQMYGQLASAYGPDMANNWLMNTLQAYGISFAGLGKMALGTQIPSFQTSPGHAWK